MHLSSPRNAELRFLAGAMAVCLSAAGSVAPAAPSGDDIATQFVEQLRAEGHGDLVLDYLERAQDDPLVSEAFRRTIPRQRLATRFEMARELPDAAARTAALAELEPELRRLPADDGGAQSLLTDVVDRLATAAADAARREAIEAERHPVASERAAKRKQARADIDRARKRLAEAESLIVAEREGLKGVQPASPAGRRRADLGARLGLVRLLGARLIHEEAQTHPEGAADRKELNQQAAKELGELYQKYSKWGVGLYAHLYEGRCYRLLGEKQLATAALEDLTAQPAPTPELRRIVTLAHAERSALALDNGEVDVALEKPATWLEGLAADEAQGPEAAALRYRLGLAALAKAESADGAAQRRLRRDARDWLGAAARVPSEVQADARDRWADVTAALGIETKPPESFDEAVAAGAEAIQAMLAFDVALESATGDEAERLRADRGESFRAAQAALAAASDLADERTDPAEAARARYQLAWLDWDGGDAEKAASRAELVARHHADTESGEQAARLALAALERLERAGSADASSRLQAMVNFILEQWPEGEVAESASAVLVSSALRSGDLAEAEKVLQTVPADQRAELALRLALARWERVKSDDEKAPAALEALRTAFDAAVAGGEPSALAVTAALYLAEAAVDNADPQAAQSLLNDPRSGPFKRLESKTSPADNPAFALATLRVAARVAALTGGDAKKTLDAIADLLKTAPAEATGGDRAWLGLAVVLLGDLDRTTDSRGVARALSAVLERLGPVVDGGDWNTRLWVAQARLRCGAMLSGEAAGRENVAAGRAAFVGLIEQAESQPGFAPSPTSVLAARLKLAECQRELGEYADAVDTLAAMLSGGAVLLDAQRVAAETLQEWGAVDKDPARLEQAIGGARPGDDGKNLIWGWSKLASVAGRFAGSDPSRRQLYFDAWRRVAESRYEAALLSSGATRADQLRKAQSTLVAVRRKNPELGGAANQQAYDQLLQRIRRAAGEAGGLSKAGS